MRQLGRQHIHHGRAAFNIYPSTVTTWQLALFTLVPQGSSSLYYISYLYVDPPDAH
jgi:hypothetical protein